MIKPDSFSWDKELQMKQQLQYLSKQIKYRGIVALQNRSDFQSIFSPYFLNGFFTKIPKVSQPPVYVISVLKLAETKVRGLSETAARACPINGNNFQILISLLFLNRGRSW